MLCRGFENQKSIWLFCSFLSLSFEVIFIEIYIYIQSRCLGVVSLSNFQDFLDFYNRFLVELDLVCAESDADDFSSTSSMYITLVKLNTEQ